MKKISKKNPKSETIEQFERWLAEKIREGQTNAVNGQRTIITIPYIVHIIHNGEALGTASNIPPAWVTDQIAALNRDFRKANADIVNLPSVFQPIAADFEIEFCPAVVDPQGNILSEPGVDRIDRNSKGWTSPSYSSSYIDGTIKPQTIWNPNDYMNMWVCDLGTSLLGYATFPSTTLLSGLNFPQYVGTSTSDGVVMTYSTFGNGNPGLLNGYTKGRVAVHEIGHWLGLRHIWGDSSCGDDFCADTPTHSSNNFGCPSFPSITCSNGPNGDLYQNYMDYTSDDCKIVFTAGQKQRAVTIMNNSPFRLSLQSSTACSLPGINVGIVSVSPPCTSGAAQSVSVTIKNKGITTLAAGDVSVVLNVSGGVSGTYTAILNNTVITGNGTEILTFNNVNLNTTADITIQAVATLAGDVFANDNTLATKINLGAPQISTPSTSVCSAAVFELKLNSPNPNATSTQWQMSSNNINFTNIASATGTTANVSQTSATYYRCKVTCGGVDYFSNILQITMAPVTSCYCTPTYSNGCSLSDEINNVTIGTLNNSSSCSSSPYYTFYNNVNVPLIQRGVPSTISIKFGTDGSQYCMVWIDHNGDGVFSSSEMVAGNTVNAGSGGTYTASITLPLGTFVGQTRMRIRGGDDSALSNTQACGATNSSYGETEDYIVDIPFTCNVPILNTVTSITETSALASYTCTSCTGSYIIEYGLANFTPGTGANAGTGGTVLTSTTLSRSITGLNPGTTYDLYVRQSCGTTSFSGNAVKKTFLTNCGSTTLPYSDGFNNGTLSTCWQSSIVTTGTNPPTLSPVTIGATPTASVPEGTHMLRFNSATASANSKIRLVSRLINTVGTSNVEVSFQMLENSLVASANDKVTLQYSLNNGTTWIDVADNVRYNQSATTPIWFTRYFNLPAEAGNVSGLRVALLFTSALGNNIHFDDFKVYASELVANQNSGTCQDIVLNNVSGTNTFRFRNPNTYAEIRPNGANLGTVTLSILENTAGSTNIPVLNNGIPYLPRYYNFKSTVANPFSKMVDVKLLYHYNELQDFNIGTNNSESIGTLSLWEYDNPTAQNTENCTPSDNTLASVLVPNSTANDLGIGFSIDFKTNHFTEFGLFPESGALRPILSAKVFLSHVDTLTSLMDDYVKTLANFPLSDPYASAPLSTAFAHVNNPTVSVTNPVVLATTGNNAIVDWLFLELRTGASGSTSVVYTKSALLQKDGDIVDMDGVSPVVFDKTPSGLYYIAIRHRFHLGFRTTDVFYLTGSPTILNFTNNSVPVLGATPLYKITKNGIYAMNAGDANADGSIDAFDTIFWEIQNGLFDDYINSADYNLDGSVDALDSILWELNNGKFQDLD